MAVILISFGILFLVIIAVTFFLPVIGKARKSYYLSPFPIREDIQFPKDFLWGSATAAQQIENTQPSDWTRFMKNVLKDKKFLTNEKGEPLPGHIAHFDDYPEKISLKTTNFDKFMEEDLEWARQNGHNAFRFSFCWSRLFPKPGKEKADSDGIKFYKNLLKLIKKNGLKPSATLFHFSSPEWFWEDKNGKTGWEREDALESWNIYVDEIIRHFGDEIDHWCTLNEPMVYIYNGYMNGLFPPNESRSDVKDVIPVMDNLLKAHRNAYYKLHENASKKNRKIEVGYTKHTREFEAYRNWNVIDRITASIVERAFIWDFMDAVETGILKVTNTKYKEEISGLKGTSDYIGINYYSRFYIKGSLRNPQNFEILMYDPEDPKEKKNDLNWAAYPNGFFEILKNTKKRYNKPIYILENGTSDDEKDDRRRQELLYTHISEMYKVMTYEQVIVKGYFYWSLMDNFEWAEGYRPRFGLLKVDYDKKFRRTPRPAANVFKEIIQHGIPYEKWKSILTEFGLKEGE